MGVGFRGLAFVFSSTFARHRPESAVQNLKPCLHSMKFIEERRRYLSCSLTRMGLPKIRSTLLGVPAIRTIIFCGLYWAPPVLGNYHIDFGFVAQAVPPSDRRVSRVLRPASGPGHAEKQEVLIWYF